MYKMKKLLSGLLSVLLLATVMISPIYAIEAETVNFDLQSTVYDDGEAIDTVILDVSNLDVDETRINKDMFLQVYTHLSKKENFLEMIQNMVYNIVVYMKVTVRLKVWN